MQWSINHHITHEAKKIPWTVAVSKQLVTTSEMHSADASILHVSKQFKWNKATDHSHSDKTNGKFYFAPFSTIPQQWTDRCHINKSPHTCNNYIFTSCGEIKKNRGWTHEQENQSTAFVTHHGWADERFLFWTLLISYLPCYKIRFFLNFH